MRLGIALVEKRDYDGAIAEYRKAIALEPHQPGAHNHLGYALMRKGITMALSPSIGRQSHWSPTMPVPATILIACYGLDPERRKARMRHR